MLINKKCTALVKYKDKIFLNPILKVEDKLLAPLVFKKYILKQIEDIQYILSRFSDSNLVKLWLKYRLEQDRIIINAKIEKYYLNNKFVYMFNENETDLATRLLKNDRFNRLHTGCYIITIDKQYYIGSTTNFKNRFYAHTNYIEDFFKEKKDNPLIKNLNLNEIQGYFLLGVKDNLNLDKKILYLNTNYLNKFKSIYPDYKLGKGEFILLKKINDFIPKFLEESLIHKFKPFLNTANDVVFKHFEWNEEFLDYNSRNDKIFECFKNKKYEIFIKIVYSKRVYYYDFLLNKYRFNIYQYLGKVSVSTSTLKDICYKYNLKYYEVLANLNKFHHYDNTTLKNPLKIVEVDS